MENEPMVYTIKCDEEIFNIVKYVSMTEELNLDPDLTPEQSMSEDATVGLERILKYYLLNYVTKKWEIDIEIDPTLDVKQILAIIQNEHSKQMHEKLDEIVKQPPVKSWEDIVDLPEDEDD